MILSAASAIEAKSVRSHRNASGNRLTRSAIVSLTAARCSGERPNRMGMAPRSAATIASAFPSPRPAPVIAIFLPGSVTVTPYTAHPGYSAELRIWYRESWRTNCRHACGFVSERQQVGQTVSVAWRSNPVIRWLAGGKLKPFVLDLMDFANLDKSACLATQ